MLLALAVWFLAGRLVAGWDQSRQALATATWGWLAVAAAAAGATVVAVAVAWHRVLAVLAPAPPLPATVGWFFLGEIGKYLPGMVWPILGRAELARRNGVAGPAAWASVPLSLGCGYLTSAAVGLAFLAVGPDVAGSAAVAVALAVAVAVGVVALHPRLLAVPLALAAAVLRRPLDLRPPPWRRMLAVLPWYVPGWVLTAVATWAAARAFDADVGFGAVAFPAVLSWLLGFLAVPVPGGVGVREAVFAASAAAWGMDPALAVLVAVVARLLFVLVDGGGFAIALLARGWRQGLSGPGGVDAVHAPGAP